MFDQALALFQAGRLAEAEAIARRILAVEPDHVQTLHLLGVVLSQQGNFSEGLELIDAALQIEPDSALLYNSRGNVLVTLKRFAEALANFEKAIELNPQFAVALGNRGNVYRELGRFNEAVASYDQALTLDPTDAEAFYNRGGALEELRRFDEAVASYDNAIALRNDYAEAFSNRGTALQALGRSSEAVTSYNRAIALKPDFPEALCSRGTAFHKMKRFDEAIASYDAAITLKPDFAEAFNYRGMSFQELARFPEALASYDKAIALKPDYSEAFQNRGIVFQNLKRFEEALSSYNNAIAQNPDYPEAFNNRGAVLKNLERLDEALASYQRALEIDPTYPYALGGLADIASRICYWTQTAKLSDELQTHITEKRSIIQPFVLLAYSSNAALQLQCAQNYTEDRISVLPEPLWAERGRHHPKLRLAYLSGQFRHHPLAYLMAELFELHNRERVEVLGVSFSPDDRSKIRSRLVGSFDQFQDVSSKSDRDVAKLLSDFEVDIAIDLDGYTGTCRPAILAHRPTPIQVSYMGFPGTMGAKFMDYVISDEIVLPFEQQRSWTERIVHLPDTYWVTNSKMYISPRVFLRGEVGLPDQGFIFCCFNNNYKITRPVFEVWMRLLRAIDGSVLWLLRDNESAEKNLRREAANRGIDPARLVFAPRMPMEDHLARHRVANLFLDTLPYNAHTTASDALWAGLPVLTCRGASFAGRVAASLLTAVGLPELVTHSLEEYEAMALMLARDAALLASIQAKLSRNREIYPLFNTKRFARHLEAAYATMWAIWQRGESPRNFAVAAEPNVHE